MCREIDGIVKRETFGRIGTWNGASIRHYTKQSATNCSPRLPLGSMYRPRTRNWASRRYLVSFGSHSVRIFITRDPRRGFITARPTYVFKSEVYMPHIHNFQDLTVSYVSSDTCTLSRKASVGKRVGNGESSI